jgi:ABC-type taurine transport system ATPase subunit
MLTKLRIRNFKRFQDVEVELGNPVVFVGPNNSGKTTALQALALWDVGLKRWIEKRSKDIPKERAGVAINRRDLLASPVPSANLLWHDLHTRDVRRTNGKQETSNVLIEIAVEGVTGGQTWTYGLEFYYANPESFYCRPAGTPTQEVPAGATAVRLAYLPPMSGLLANETLVPRGAINVRLGEGRTAEVLRNLCYQIVEGKLGWEKIHDPIFQLFGVELEEPQYIEERGEISMSYQDSGVAFDLSSSGRGLQQTVLLLAHLSVNPGSVLLLDEPDAHLETLRQRQTYQLLSEAARGSDSQIVAASHSEVILNEAADRDVVVAFLGQPHRIDDRGKQLLKALREIGFEHYYQAEQRGWVLYLEGSTDLAILKEWARLLDHEAQAVLERPFVHYVGNDRMRAVSHFYGLREAKRDLAGVALFDRDREAPAHEGLAIHVWKRREIENYLCTRETLLEWARHSGGVEMPLLAPTWGAAMEESMVEIEDALKTLGRPSPWSPDLKVSDEFLPAVFRSFYAKLSLPNLMEKSNYHQLAPFVPSVQLDPEVTEVLDLILGIARQARPA